MLSLDLAVSETYCWVYWRFKLDILEYPVKKRNVKSICIVKGINPQNDLFISV